MTTKFLHLCIVDLADG